MPQRRWIEVPTPITRLNQSKNIMKKRFSIALTVTNLLGRKEYIDMNRTAINYSYFSKHIRGREVISTLRFSFQFLFVSLKPNYLSVLMTFSLGNTNVFRLGISSDVKQGLLGRTFTIFPTDANSDEMPACKDL